MNTGAERPASGEPGVWLDRLLRVDRRLLVGAVVPLTVLVAVLDWWTGPEVAVGAAYLFPMMLLSLVASPAAIVAAAAGCALLRGAFSIYFSEIDFVLRYLLAFAAYTASGLLISEMIRHQRQTKAHLNELEIQHTLRREVEEHLRELAESSPAAIFTADEDGRILTANAETSHLFALGAENTVRGQDAGAFLPLLAGALRLEPRAEGFRTSAQCQGRRQNGESFFAQVWFSVYERDGRRKLAAIAVDISEEIREREDQNLRLLADHNRIIAGAVSHELRNICGAIAMAVSNLNGRKGEGPEGNLTTLNGLVDALIRVVSTDLAAKSKPAMAPVRLDEVLSQLGVLIEPTWRECGGVVVFDMGEMAPRVMADPAGLTQVFLNLANNSLRAVRGMEKKELRFTVRRVGPEVHVQVTDTGVGIEPGTPLFEPFQVQASGVGLGLYVSRAVLRSYGGDLKHEESHSGCTFCMKLPAAG